MANAAATLYGYRRQLTRRLAAVGILASVLAGIAAFFIETERLDDVLVNNAALEARGLVATIPETGGLGDIALRDFLESHAATSRDFFVVAELYGPDRQVVGEAALPAFAQVGESVDRGDHQFPAEGATWYKKTLVAGRPFLQVMVPLTRAGRHLGWFEGIYRLAPESVDAIRADVARITMLVVGAVFLTALALHPLLASLQKNVLATAHDLLRANIDTLQVLGGAIAKRDSDTSAHNFRVTIYAVRIGEAMGLDDGAIRRVIKGSFLHDVGKIAIRDSILLKPGKLTAEEFAEMRTHVAHGLDIIAANTWLRDAREIVGGHHEKVDGTGYPLGLAGDAIPLAARIFAVADVFDALTSRRPYKAAMPDEEALTILEEGRGKHFDTAVLDAFGGILGDIRAELSSTGDVEALADRILARYFTA